MQLQFPTLTQFKIDNVNVRDEVHGAEHTPAIDLAVSCTTANTFMDQIEEGLCQMFYMPATETNTNQPEIEGVEPISSFPKLRTTLIKKINLDKEYAGYVFSIQGGTGDLSLGDLKFNKIGVALLEGGSIQWKFRLQASGVDAETIGYFGTLVQHWIQATLTISPDAQKTIEESGNVVPIKSEAKKDEKTATDLFVEGSTKT